MPRAPNEMQKFKYPRSRFGCSNCRKRHVKCDEGIPCQHCVRRKEKCSLEQQTTSSRSRSFTPPSLTGTLPPLSAFQDGDWALEMYLMHHYTLSTSASFFCSDAIRHTFRIEVPRLSLAHPILLSAMLASSALHILATSMYDHRISLQYRRHGTKVIEVLQQNINKVNPENCHWILACSALLGFFTVTENYMDGGLDPSSGCDRLAQSLYMFAGTAEIVKQMPLAIERGPLHALLHGHWVPLPIDFKLAEDATIALNRLRDAILEEEGMNDEDRETLLATWRTLETMYLETAYLMKTAKAAANHVFKFVIMIPQHFTRMVQCGDNWALILYAYFAILCVSIEGAWSMNKTYAEKVVTFVRSYIQLSLQEYLDWAEEHMHADLAILMDSKRLKEEESIKELVTPTWKTFLDIQTMQGDHPISLPVDLELVQ